MGSEWQSERVIDLQRRGVLLVEDGNHGEYRPRRDEFVESGVVFVRAADMDGGRVLFETASRINDVAVNRIRKGIGKGGDILLSHKGTVGKVAYVPSDAPPFVCSPQTTFWRVLDHGKINATYLYAYMRSHHFQTQLRSRQNETDMAAYVSLTAQRDLVVLLPPIQEQRRIAHILGTLDDKIELNRRMNRTLEAMAAAIFKSWFIDFDPVRAKAAGRDPGLPKEIADLFPDSFQDSQLGPIPEGWELGKLRDVIEVLDSKRIPLSSAERAKRKGPYPYYGAAGILDHVDDFLFSGPHVLVGEDGSVVTEDDKPIVQYVWGEFWVNNHAHVLRGSNGFTEEQLYLFLKQLNIRPYVTGAVQPKLNQRNMNSVPLTVPPASVSAAFGHLAGPLFQKLRANADEAHTLMRLRDTLLPKLLSGELEVPAIGDQVEEVRV